MSILVLAEHHDGQLAAATAHVVAAAQAIGGDIDVLVAGDNVGAVADAAAKLDGVSKVRVADNGVYAHQLAEPVSALLAELAGGYSHVLAAASTTGKNILPRVAALKDVAQLSEVLEVVDADTFKRPIYAGNAIATVKSADSLKVITVRTTGFDAVGASGSASVENVDTVVENTQSTFLKQELAESDRPELGGARVVISGGRGMGSGENFKLLDGIADKLGAAIGASRAAVDIKLRLHTLWTALISIMQRYLTMRWSTGKLSGSLCWNRSRKTKTAMIYSKCWTILGTVRTNCTRALSAPKKNLLIPMI